MSSPYPPLVHTSRLADENPTVLTIRAAKSADANGDGAPGSLFGANARRIGSGSARTERSRYGKTESGKNSEKLGFLRAENTMFKAYTEKSSLGESEKSELATITEKSGLLKAEDSEIEANTDKLGYGGGSGTGGKLRSLRRGGKRTPYDRPATGRHATAGGSAAMAASSLPASSKLTIGFRLRDSASRLIHSSASYLFSALFKRLPPAIKANGESPLTGASNAVEEEIYEDRLEDPAKQNDRSAVLDSQVPSLVDAVAKPTEAEGKVLDIAQVEEILKGKTWSREQVNRLTQILQKRVSGSDAAYPAVEAEKVQEQLRADTKDSSPIQVARAFMGEQATRPSGIASTVRKSGFLSNENQASPVRTLVEDRYPSSPFSRGWAPGSGFVRMPKRSLAVEDDFASIGPVRRVRQKTSMFTNVSPCSYSRRMTGLSKPLETHTSSPPSQSSQTALKILETLEKLSPSPQGKFLEASAEKSVSGPRVLDKFSPALKGKFSTELVGLVGTSASEQTPETSKAREKGVAQNSSLVVSPKSTESNLIGQPTFGGVKFTDREAVMKTSSCIPKSNSKAALGKGFRMNAVFEESNSDEEAKLQAKLYICSETRDWAAPPNLRGEAMVTPISPVVSTSAEFSAPFMSFLPDSVPASSSSTSMLKSHSFTAATPSLPDKAEPSVAAVSNEPTESPASFLSFSFPPVALERRASFPAATASPTASSDLSISPENVFRVPDSATAKPALPSMFAMPTEAFETSGASPITVVSSATACEFTKPALPFPASVGTAAPGKFGNASTIGTFLSPVSTTASTLTTHTGLSEADSAVTMATESPVAEKLAEVDRMATDHMTEEAGTSIMPSPTSPMPTFLFNTNAQPSPSSAFSFAAGVSNTPLSASAFPFSGGLGTALAGPSASLLFAPPFAFDAQSGAAFTGQAPNSTTGASTSISSTAAFTFGGQSITSSAGQAPLFAVGAPASSSSSTPFAFGAAQSGTGPTPTFETKAAVLFGQSKSSTGSSGQAPSFGALPSSPANPFSSTSGNSSSPFVFGPSTAAASTTSSVFTSSSSGVPSFGGPPSPFQFGTPAMSSPLTSGPSSSSTTTHSFTSSPFPSSPASTSLATPPFSFGAAATPSPSAGSASSGQQFSSGAAQPNPFAANLFSSSATQNPAPAFNFGAPAMTAAPSPFSSAPCASSASMFVSNAAPNGSNIFAFGSVPTPNHTPFAFGSGQPASVQAATPGPFAFGGQSAAVTPASGQPFGFNGGQPSAPAPNPFSAAGSAQSGLNGGFALGAAGGDKSGRKFIKAKRIGAKRGK